MATSSGPSIETAVAKAKSSALAIAAKLVQAFESRCGITRAECEGQHFSACQSRLPAGECVEQVVTADVCKKAGCGFIQDFDHPVVRMPPDSLAGPNYNLSNFDALETVCYSLVLDPTLKSEHVDSAGVEISPIFNYFGSWTGVMRMYPGSGYSVNCGDYDPRVRPWYVAASSGPKDVVVIVDISGSMDDNGRLALAQDAVKSVLDTMNEHTFVNIVLFSTDAEVLTTEDYLLPATDDNKERMLGLLESVETGGATNFGDAISTAFDLLETSRAMGDNASSECTTAILLLTDGEITHGDPEDEIVALVEELNVDINAQLFTFALGPEADTVTLKTIACGTGGVYQAVPDGGSLATAMSFYYRYYAIGLGKNVDYTAFSSIYTFSPGVGSIRGFTVASPAYDLNFDPPAFLGVAGVDFTLQSFLDLGFTIGEIEEQVYLGGRDCPVFNLTDCQLQQFRGSISADSVCSSGCIPDGASLEPVRCMEADEYPTNVWNNIVLTGRSYAERNCCTKDKFDPSSVEQTCEITDGEATSATDDIGPGVVAGIAVGALVLLLGVVYGLRRRKRKRTFDIEQARETTTTRSLNGEYSRNDVQFPRSIPAH